MREFVTVQCNRYYHLDFCSTLTYCEECCNLESYKHGKNVHKNLSNIFKRTGYTSKPRYCMVARGTIVFSNVLKLCTRYQWELHFIAPFMLLFGEAEINHEVKQENAASVQKIDLEYCGTVDSTLFCEEGRNYAKSATFPFCQNHFLRCT
jgi:hypothetical protein